jgi:hypothetical protein
MTARDRKPGALAFLLQKTMEMIDYRTPRMVTEMVVYQNTFGANSYYICPRCDCPLDREFMHFCDRCGQKLGWQNFLHARIREHPKKNCSELLPENTFK